MRGRKPKPTHLKLVQGNPGHRPLNESEPIAPPGIPEPPEYLSERARIEWARTGPILKEAGLLSLLDRNQFAVYCQAVATLGEASESLAKHGAVVKYPTGAIGMSPYYTQYNKAVEHIAKFSAEFGLTPSSRSRISATADPSEDPLDAFLKHGTPKAPSR